MIYFLSRVILQYDLKIFNHTRKSDRPHSLLPWGTYARTKSTWQLKYRNERDNMTFC